MNGYWRKLRVVAFPLVLSLLLGAVPSDYSRLVATGKYAIGAMESSQEKLAMILRPLIEMKNNGVKAFSKEYWDKNVTPILLLADKELSSLPDTLTSVLPTNFNIKSNDPKNEPWVSIYDLSNAIKYIDLKRQKDNFDSEYLMLFIGASNYVEMYVNLIYSRYEQIGQCKEKLQTIIASPDRFRRERVELKQKEEREKAEKKKYDKLEHEQNALRRSPITPKQSLDRYESPFSFLDIPLGLEFHDCVKRFRLKGNLLERQETMKDMLYGFTPVAFLNGTYNGYPIRIKIQASSQSYRVYEISILINMVLDEYEADELMNSIATNFAFTHPNYTVEAQSRSQSLSITQSLDDSGRLFDRMGIPSLGIILRDFSIKSNKNSYTGMISLCCVKDMGKPGCFVDYRLYDHKIGLIAQDEAK